MTEQEALDAANQALGRSLMPLAVQDLTMVEGRLIWTVRTATIGSGSIVRINDADGAVIENMRWGIR